MPPRHPFRLLSRLGLAAGALVASAAAGALLAQGRAPGGGLVLFNQVRAIVADRYVDATSDSTLFEAAARGLVEGLDDPYAELVAPKDLQAFSVEAYGKYGGVGLLVEDHDGATLVRRVYPNTPAERAGVRQGDRIVAVGDSSTAGWKFGDVTKALKGPPGTAVRATFRREAVPEPITVTLTRAVIHVPSVPYAMMLDGGVGYVPLQQFSETATAEVSEAMLRLERQGARSFVLDLRGNGGGIMDQALATSSLFLPERSLVARVEYRSSAPESLVTTGAPLSPSVPLAVLVDGGSASAAEIVAGALQDHDRALVVGATSFGKGLVQGVFRLDGGYMLKLTTGRWYTPSGRSIHLPRTLVAGRFVMDSTAEALAADTLHRPVFRSDAGRRLFGGGAITPDVLVAGDTLTDLERRVATAIAPKAQAVYLQLYDFVKARKPQLSQTFAVTPAWRDEVYRRMQGVGVALPRPVYDSAQGYMDRLIGEQVSRLAFGDSAAVRRFSGEDAQLQRALAALRGAGSQEEVFAAVGRGKPAG